MRKKEIININDSKESVVNGLTTSLDWIAFTIQEDKKTRFQQLRNHLDFKQMIL